MDFEKYKVKVKCPNRPAKPSGFVMLVDDFANDSEHHHDESFRVWKEQCKAYLKRLEEFKAEIEKYNEEKRKNESQFRNDLFQELGISENPNREKLFEKAWEDGHSAGYEEVYSIACDLVDLIAE